MRELLAETALPKLIREIPHEEGEDTITHLIRPTDLIRLIHSSNRRNFGHVFGANPVTLKRFWESLFASEDGREFNNLHPTLKNKDPAVSYTHLTLPTKRIV